MLNPRQGLLNGLFDSIITTHFVQRNFSSYYSSDEGGTLVDGEARNEREKRGNEEGKKRQERREREK